MSAIGWVMIAYSSNCLISQEWLASIAEGDSIINATLLYFTKNFITVWLSQNCVWVMLFTGRQTRWDVLTLGPFDLGHFNLGHFDSGTFWLWDVLTRDVLTLGRFDLGQFDFGTFWPVCLQKMFAISNLIKYSENILGTFWLTKNGTFSQITWDVLVLGRFDRIPERLPYVSMLPEWH